MISFGDNLESILKEISNPVHSANYVDGLEHDNRVKKGVYDQLGDKVKPPGGTRLIERLLGKHGSKVSSKLQTR